MIKLGQFNMAVDKTRRGKEVGGKRTIINALGENGKEKLVTTFLKLKGDNEKVYSLRGSSGLAGAFFGPGHGIHLGCFHQIGCLLDSVQQGKKMNGTIGRNNDPNLDHGRLKFTAQGSRFNFTIKGPDLSGR